MPIKQQFEIILGWNQILFVFNLQCQFVECIDLLHPHGGRFKCNMTEQFDFEWIVHDEKNNLHLLQLNAPSDSEMESGHYKISLIDLLPLEILKINQPHHRPLIIGYCKNCEKENEIQSIPNYLKHLILKYYPIFL